MDDLKDHKCQKLPLRSGVLVSPHHCNTTNQDYGLNCSFSCSRGYQLSGPPAARCGIGGDWSADVNKVSCNGLQLVTI